MPLVIESTTDSKEAVTAALGDLASKTEEVEETKSASADTDETVVESDTTEEKEEADKAEKEEDQDDNQDDEDADTEKPKKRGGFKRRIDKLNSRLSAVEQEREYWREQALGKKQTPEPTKPQPKDGRPNSDNFERHEDYIEALAEWKTEAKLAERDKVAKEEKLKQEYQKSLDDHLARVKKFTKTHNDFEDVISDVDDIPMSLAVRDIILDSDNGPELMYELAKDREEFERICSLPAFTAARELGKFEVRLQKSAESKGKLKTKTKAPPPITPVKSKSTGLSNKSIYDKDLSQREYEKLREKQLS